MTVTIYGIKACDTMKKARDWLEGHKVAYDFHDFKKQGVSMELLTQWTAAAGWERVLNRQGQTWRKLDAAEQARAVDAASACALMQLHTSLIKRPVIDWSGAALTVGWQPAAFEAALAQALT